MNKPRYVTFTGIDERTDIERVLHISTTRPVEWGVLFSSVNSGRSPRYPSLDFVGNVILRHDFSLSLSAHVCGRWAENIIERGDCSIALAMLLDGSFQRVQINVADGETKVHGPVRPERAAAFAELVGATSAVLQCREPFPPSVGVSWLFDRSGGAGVRETSWPKANSGFNGYAGGIGPDTIEEDIAAIAAAAGKAPYWIDMEQRVRTDDWLDLDKCERVLKAVYG